MKERLISVGIGVLAKEKGFNEKVLYYYDGSDMVASQAKNVFDLHNYNLHKGSTFRSAPTQSLLQKWLREKYDIHIEIIWVDTLSNIYVYHISTTGNAVRPDSVFYSSYEEALEAGLLEGLKLI